MPKIVGIRERTDHMIPVHFELCSGDTPYYRHRLAPEETLVVHALEGTLLEGDPAALARVRLHLDCGRQRDVYNVALHQITPRDSALEARVRRLETVLDGILEVDAKAEEGRVPKVDVIDRTASVLRKLGYKPHATVDHRRLVYPEVVDGYGDGELSVRLVCAKTPLLEVPVKWLLTIHGIRSRDIL